MYGKSEDVPGECNAHLYIADDYGDNSGTMRCQLPEGHELPHREEFARDDKPVVITWYPDERRRCDHACGQWRHNHDDDNVDACPKNAEGHDFSTCAFCNPGVAARPCVLCQTPIYTSAHHLCPKRVLDAGSPPTDDEVDSEHF